MNFIFHLDLVTLECSNDDIVLYAYVTLFQQPVVWAKNSIENVDEGIALTCWVLPRVYISCAVSCVSSCHIKRSTAYLEIHFPAILLTAKPQTRCACLSAGVYGQTQNFVDLNVFALFYSKTNFLLPPSVRSQQLHFIGKMFANYCIYSLKTNQDSRYANMKKQNVK